MPTLALTGEQDADALLSDNPLALLIGMLLDQQVPMEWAFASPATLAERLDGPLDAATIAAMDPEELVELACEKPAIHRYPAAMARRIHAMCEHIVEHHDGDAQRVWDDAADGKELFKNIAALPGFGKQKAQIFTALLAKQCGVDKEGWEEKAGDYGKPGYRSIADVTSPETLLKVRETKQAKKAEKKAAAKKAAAKP